MMVAIAAVAVLILLLAALAAAISLRPGTERAGRATDDVDPPTPRRRGRR